MRYSLYHIEHIYVQFSETNLQISNKGLPDGKLDVVSNFGGGFCTYFGTTNHIRSNKLERFEFFFDISGNILPKMSVI